MHIFCPVLQMVVLFSKLEVLNKKNDFLLNENTELNQLLKNMEVSISEIADLKSDIEKIQKAITEQKKVNVIEVVHSVVSNLIGNVDNGTLSGEDIQSDGMILNSIWFEILQTCLGPLCSIINFIVIKYCLKKDNHGELNVVSPSDNRARFLSEY